MTNEIAISKTLSIRDCGLDEYWLQDQIATDPSILNLGTLELVRREKRQSSGGRLDLLLQNPEADTMYEVEVMLGETDASHIIRTIEYWDLEKRRYPQRQHFAVLVAETVTRRFFNVIQLLSVSIPIVAVQANLIEAGGKRILHFTKVLDSYEEPGDEVLSSGESRETFSEEAWVKKSPTTLACAKAFVAAVSRTLPDAGLKYFKTGLGIYLGSRCYFWFKPKDSDKSLLMFTVDEGHIEQTKMLLEQGGLLPLLKGEDFLVLVDANTIKTKAELFSQLGGVVDEARRSEKAGKESSSAD
jgi:hypothetical protein